MAEDIVKKVLEKFPESEPVIELSEVTRFFFYHEIFNKDAHNVEKLRVKYIENRRFVYEYFDVTELKKAKKFYEGLKCQEK